MKNLFTHIALGFLTGFWFPAACWAETRTWTDKTSHYKLEAEFLARSDSNVVLQKKDKSLVMVKIAELSDSDQKFLNSEDLYEKVDSLNEYDQRWTLRNGLVFKGSVIEYGRRRVSVRRYRNEMYVNDKKLDEALPIYQHMVPRIVSYFEKEDLKTISELKEWAAENLNSRPRTYICDGVMFEISTGDHYMVPFFLLTADDRKILEPGWDEWKDEKEDSREREEYDLALRVNAHGHQRNQQAIRQITRLHLQTQAYGAGMFDLWEVSMIPQRGGHPVAVVVPGRDSRQATMRAKAKYPTYSVASVAKQRRQY